MDDKLQIIDKTKTKISPPHHYKVVMYNDDFTTMEFVVDILVRIFHKNIKEATDIMLDVHKKGYGIAGIYPFDIAKTKVTHAMREARNQGFPFKMTVEE
ncbi:ATP-dependent Clp protease adaptor ClpS [Anaeromicropila herbilytica]|uniref:ATP-dependent Clp protease adapter protein ClpS n=1 Tax=Anaeromicropila herbilytica TaxID=2785025 RepID=A0A7R7EIT3_9FIRM|nr:ATP-dependent Clp protease adaptor ClpS [Anaeromicropila herbilytica]BCN29935.1 ATP-dependent Clp protease adapter protein ClpS [Anaeromicropila herbilytica]